MFLVNLGFVLLMFGALLEQGNMLQTGDSNLGAIVSRQRMLPLGFTGHFWYSPLLGYTATRSLTWYTVLNWLLPAHYYNNWVYAVDLCAASLVLALFWSRRSMSAAAILIGTITALWLGSNFTLLHAGHIGKFGVIMFFLIAIWCIGHASQGATLGWSLLAGGAIGGMFLEQQDVALFFGLFAGAYAVFAWARLRGWSVRGLLMYLAPMGVTALLVAGWSLINVYVSVIGGTEPAGEQGDPQQQWEFVTQWSVPPDEIVDLIAPGYTGWRSGEPEGPYWGRTGQSAGWEKTHQGFQNFRLESIYLGAIPVGLAILALVVYIRRRPEGKEFDPATLQMLADRRAECFFWGIAAVVALLLSFGKYFPLYALFYKLPLVGSIRNPNKFIQIFQLAVGILAAYGLDAVIRKEISGSKLLPEKRVFRSAVGIALLGAILTVFAGFLVATRGEQEQVFVRQGWGNAAPVIVQNMVRAVFHGGVLSFVLAGGLVGILHFRRKQAWKHVTWIAVALVLVVALDAKLLARHYVKTVERESITAEDDLIRYLKMNLDKDRVALLTEQGFYNHWLSVVFPYHDIAAFNIVQMPRVPADYQKLMTALGRNPVRFWELASVRYVIGPVQAWQQIQQNPDLASRFSPAMGFKVYQTSSGGIGVNPVMDVRQAEHVLLRFDGVPRFSLVDKWQVVPGDDQVLAAVSASSFNPRKEAVLSSSPGSDTFQSAGVSGRVNVVDMNVKQATVQTEQDTPAILVFSQKYDKDWIASVDGKPVPVLKCNFIELGVAVPAGRHEAIFRYQPPVWGLYVQGLGMLLCLGAGVSLVVKKVRVPVTGPGLGKPA